MTSTHTPGPWYNGLDVPCYQAESGTLTSVFDPDLPAGELSANIALATAAPALLDIARLALFHARDYDKLTPGLRAEFARLAQSAIALATGEATP